MNIERFKYFPNFLIVRGTGRNVGKTLSACNIISNLAKDHDVVGIKISPHFHKLDEYHDFVCNSGDFVVVEEKLFSAKDSSRMLQAGATKVFYIQAKNDQVMNAINMLTYQLNPASPVVVESGGLYNYIEPALLLNVIGENSEKKIDIRNKTSVVNLPSDKVSSYDWSLIHFINGKFTVHA